MTQLSGTTLAYIGDAIYEVMIREMLIKKGYQKVDNLHKEAIKYTSAVGQKVAIDLIFDQLTEEEVAVFKRGRNANTDRKARNASLGDYKQATGFEALIGYLYLEKRQDRLTEIMSIIINES
jgi:ribonuclease-3 family protein